MSSRPTVIECSTIIGYGSRLQNTNAVHGSPLNPEQIQELRDNLDYKIPPFTIHPSVEEDMSIVKKRGADSQRQFNLALQRLESKDINLYNQYIKLSQNEFKFD
jgi:transketolase